MVLQASSVRQPTFESMTVRVKLAILSSIALTLGCSPARPSPGCPNAAPTHTIFVDIVAGGYTCASTEFIGQKWTLVLDGHGGGTLETSDPNLPAWGPRPVRSCTAVGEPPHPGPQ